RRWLHPSPRRVRTRDYVRGRSPGCVPGVTPADGNRANVVGMSTATPTTTRLPMDRRRPGPRMSPALRKGVLVPMLTSALVCLGSGLLLGLATRWGLARYWWVLAKLVITVALTVL